MPGMIFEGRFNRAETLRLLDELDLFWQRLVTVILTLPYIHPRRSGTLLAEDISLDRLTWIITTCDINSHYIDPACLPLPDT